VLPDRGYEIRIASFARTRRKRIRTRGRLVSLRRLVRQEGLVVSVVKRCASLSA